jgi:DamX protein
VLAALTRPGLPETLYLFEETRRGRPWFQLIHSLHGDRGAARAALATLPPELKRLAPWVRELPRGSELEVLVRER